jgi:excisionase family DNA binding protein
MENKENNAIYLSVKELADIMGISRIAVFKKIQKGQIPAKKVGRSYVISVKDIPEIIQKRNPKLLTEEKKEEIKHAVEKVVKEYGETLRLLGKE